MIGWGCVCRNHYAPKRLVSGCVFLRGAPGYGELLSQAHSVNLAPTGRHLQAEAVYHLPLAGGALEASLGAERQPQHARTRGIQVLCAFPSPESGRRTPSFSPKAQPTDRPPLRCGGNIKVVAFILNLIAIRSRLGRFGNPTRHEQRYHCLQLCNKQQKEIAWITPADIFQNTNGGFHDKPSMSQYQKTKNLKNRCPILFVVASRNNNH